MGSDERRNTLPGNARPKPSGSKGRRAITLAVVLALAGLAYLAYLHLATFRPGQVYHFTQPVTVYLDEGLFRETRRAPRPMILEDTNKYFDLMMAGKVTTLGGGAGTVRIVEAVPGGVKVEVQDDVDKGEGRGKVGWITAADMSHARPG